METVVSEYAEFAVAWGLAPHRTGKPNALHIMMFLIAPFFLMTKARLRQINARAYMKRRVH